MEFNISIVLFDHIGENDNYRGGSYQQPDYLVTHVKKE
jgi:hypothetical protein